MATEAIEDQRREIYEIAEALAPTWEARRDDIERVCAPVREWMLRELAPREGDTVLELAAGTGDTGFEAAALVGEGGRLIASDFSPAMLEACRRRGAELGARNVEYRIIDAERIELEDHAVDGVLCRFGYMLMADPAAALVEARRVLRPGGRLALAVWGALERNPFFGIVAISLVQHGHLPPPEPPGPPAFSMASAERTSGLVAGSGFGEVRTEEVSVAFEIPDVDEYLSVVADTSGPIGLALRGLSDPDRAEIRAEAEDSLARFAAERGYALPGVVLCAVAS
ncbi:MAG: methyltransferase domain-containing protein [Solirubrobacterales bacterium]|nr:methyltransferase domain-containing protein [Solirubrobacterales bacterium]